jgi:hypothetical protein
MWLSITTVFVAAVLLFLLERSALQYSGVMPVDDRIQYYKLCVDLAKAVLVGFGAALLGILTPAVFASVEPFHLFRYLDERSVTITAKGWAPVIASTLLFGRS